MSFKDDLALIKNAIKDRRSIHNMNRSLNKENEEDIKKERLVNSVTSEMMNLFSVIEENAKMSKITLDACVFEPKRVSEKISGTYQDPKVLAEAMKLDPDFNRVFELKTFKDDEGHVQYLLKKRNLEI